jgi:dolichyl-phosphate-mannose-protein mannosyltransferase
MPTNPDASTNRSSTLSARREVLVVLGFTALASLPRFAGFGRQGLTHFDEGVYAMSGFWSMTPKGLAGLDPGIIPYAPPVLPILIGLTYSVLGVADASALMVTAICGVLTIPIVGWVGRRTFGPGAGAAAAALAACSLAHIAFSRKALTDTPFLLAWVAAIGHGGRFLERPGFLRALAFGAAVGLAQNVKYNGWVALVIVVLAALSGLVADPTTRCRSAVLRVFGWGLCATTVAALAYLPWFEFVEAHGGYSSLMRHHRGYVGGPSDWLPNLQQQLAQVTALSGGMLVAASAWTVAWFGAAVALLGNRIWFPTSRWDAARLRMGWLLGAAALATLPELAWWVGLAWSGWLLFDPNPSRRVIAAWWIIMSLMTPLYHPYARLWLPLHAVGWLMLAGGIVTFGPFPGSALEPPAFQVWTRKKVLAQGAVALVCLVLARTHWIDERPKALPVAEVFAPTDGFKLAVANALKFPAFADNPRAELHVLGRRPLAFYLALHGRRFVLTASEDDLIHGPTGPDDWALVDGVQLGEGLHEGSRWRHLEPLWRQRLQSEEVLDPVTRLDINPAAPFEHYPPDTVQLWLLEAWPRKAGPQ